MDSTLDPLDSSDEVQEIDTKDVLHDHGVLALTKDAVDSDNELNVEHVSPHTLLETPEENIQYALRTAEGNLITYRVLHVDESNAVPQIVTTTTNLENSNVQPLLANNFNGSVYVIPSNQVFHAQSKKAPAKRNAANLSATANPNKRRDDKRRATHNEVERRRRDKINNWIIKLSKIIPESCTVDVKAGYHFDGQSKGGILAKACEYILQLRQVEEKAEDTAKDHAKLQKSIQTLQHKNTLLTAENKRLRDILKRHGIDVSENVVTTST